MTPEQIRQRGLEVLARELGPVGLIRFLQQFELGEGDYTTQRHEWLKDDVQTIVQRIGENPTRQATNR